MPSEVEFLPDGSAPEQEAQPGRRSVPRWTWLAVCAAAIALVVAAVVTRPDTAPRKAAPPPTFTSVPTPTWAPPAPDTAVADIALAGGTTWELYADHVTAGGRTAPLAQILSNVGTPRLVPDLTHDRMWIVVENSGPGQILEIDAHTLRPVHTVPSMGTIVGAADLDGKLYVVTGPYLVAIGGDGTPRTVLIAPTTAFGGLAADAAHGRLIVVDATAPTHLWSYRPGGRLIPIPVRLPVANGSLVVAHGQIWVGGYEGGGGGAVVEHVIERATPRLSQVGPDAVIVGVGDRVVWMTGTPGSAELWCVDATTGRTLQHWAVDGQVASTSGHAVVATPTGIRQLSLDGCPG